MKSQLPTAIADAEPYIISDEYAASQKLDGHRVMIDVGGFAVTAYNRKGDERNIPGPIEDKLRRIRTRWTFDGELVEGTYYVFDILSTPEGDIRQQPWIKRYELLEHLISRSDFGMVTVPSYFGTLNKREFFERSKELHLEGVIFKKVNGIYKPGRNTNFVKLKFVREIDCFITDESINDKDNFELSVYKGDQVVQVGKVSAVTGDGPTLKVGDVVTVQVLYCTSGGKLYQPVTPRLRTDKLAEECTFDQIIQNVTNRKVLL